MFRLNTQNVKRCASIPDGTVFRDAAVTITSVFLWISENRDSVHLMHVQTDAKKYMKDVLTDAGKTVSPANRMYMNKILLLGINARYTHSNPSLLYLKSSISDLEVYCSITEFTIGESPENILKEIIFRKPDLLAISVYIWNSFHVKSILKKIKVSCPEIKIVLGGPEVSYNSGEWISRFEEIDYIITGGGEAAFRELVISVFPGDKKIITGFNPPFSSIRFPYCDEDMKNLTGKYIYYESSRGCAFNCSYCLSSVNSQSVEYRSIDQVKAELDFFYMYNLPLIKFVDRTFNLKREHYTAVWDYIIKKFSGSSTCFHFEIFPELLNPEDLKFLSAVPPGLFQFEMGIQSTNSKTLTAINRSGSWKKAEQNIRKLVEAGNIHLHTDLIAGLPYEDLACYSDSFNKVFSLGAEHFQGGFLKILPGTGMSLKVEEYGIVHNSLPPYEITENRWISNNEMERLKLVSELVDLIHNAGKFSVTENFLLSLYGEPFIFFDRLADFFRRESSAAHRKWEYLAEIIIEMVTSDHPESDLFLKDCLRWDWCCVMKHHHFPELLKSESTVAAKRRGYRFFINNTPGEMIEYSGVSFPGDDLRRSIFFLPETEKFEKEKMNGKMAMFLPDKRIIFFNCD